MADKLKLKAMKKMFKEDEDLQRVLNVCESFRLHMKTRKGQKFMEDY